MYRIHIGLVLAAMGVGGRWGPAATGVRDEPASMPQVGRQPGEAAPPAPWLQGDPADSLYRAAREALGRREFRAAADLFGSLPARFPRSAYAPDSFYWQAFALYRLGGEAQLRGALGALRAQRARFPTAATQGDAAALERRIQGELARRGDQSAAAAVAEAASAAAAATEATAAAGPVEAGDVRDCDEEGDDIKIAAVNALIHMDDEKARPILRRILARRDAGSVCLRRKAVFLVAQGGGEGTEDILLETSRTDPDLEVREQAVFWLSQVGTEKAVGALDSILRHSTDRRIQERALFALSQHGSPRAQASLRAYVERSDVAEELREKAIFWIGQTGDRESGAYLRQLFGRIKDEELRKKVLFSVSQMDGPENRSWLLSVARDRTEPVEVRKQALFWAGQSGVPIAELGTLYGTLDDRELKEQVIFVLSQREEPAALDRLLEIARRDGDPELRKKALFWLGQSDDPRAAKALQDIIEQP